MGFDMTHRQAMKFENQRKILNLINKAPVSRTNIAAETGLTQASISIIVEDLIQAGIIRDTEKVKDEPNLGRKPTLLDINPEWGYIVGICIDRDGTDIGITNIKGQVIDRFERFPTQKNYTAHLDTVAQVIDALIERNHNVKKKIIGVGVAIPGPFDSESGTLLNPPGFFREWHNLNLYHELRKRINHPIAIEHNSIATARAEKCLNPAAALFSNFVVLSVGVGIGAGLILNGEVYSATRGYGGEFGHTSIDYNGLLCSCGNRGCLEQYASISALLYNIQRLRPEIGTWEQLVDFAYKGDDLCDRYIVQEADYISQSIINLNNLLGLDAVIITGQLTYRPERILKRIRQKIDQSILTKNYRSIYVDISSIKDGPHISSGAAIIIDQIFNKELFYYRSNERLYKSQSE